MIFSKNQRYLTTRITYTIRKLTESAITANTTKRTRPATFIYIFFKKKREKASHGGNGGTMKNSDQ